MSYLVAQEDFLRASKCNSALISSNSINRPSMILMIAYLLNLTIRYIIKDSSVLPILYVHDPSTFHDVLLFVATFYSSFGLFIPMKLEEKGNDRFPPSNRYIYATELGKYAYVTYAQKKLWCFL